jgi:hypothetical protein
VSPVNGVRSARNDNQLTGFNQLRQSCCGGLKRQNSIDIAMNDQGWYINAGQIIAEISQPGRYTVILVIPTATSPSARFISVSIATWSQRFALLINYYATYPPSNINVSTVLMDERR